MDKYNRKKIDIRPKKICRPDGCYWIPNRCINEHYLSQRLEELGKHEDIYNADHRQRQKEVQRELRNIRASRDTKNGIGYFKRKERNCTNPKSRNLSLTEMIDKFKTRRVESELLNELVKQQRYGSQYTDESLRERSPSKLLETIATAKADDIGMKPRKGSKEMNILDEMKASLETARRLSSESSWDEIFDNVRRQKKRNSDPSIVKKTDYGRNYGSDNRMYRRRNTLHADSIEQVTKRMDRPRKIIGEQTSVVQLNIKRRTPIYVEEYSPRQHRRRSKQKTKKVKKRDKGQTESCQGLVRERTFYQDEMKSKSKDKQNLNNYKDKTKGQNAHLKEKSMELNKEKVENSQTEGNNAKSKYLKKNLSDKSYNLNNTACDETESAKISDVRNVINNLSEPTDTTNNEKGNEIDKNEEKEGKIEEKMKQKTDGSNEEIIENCGINGVLHEFGSLIREPTEMIYFLEDETETENYEQKFEDKLARIKKEDAESGNYNDLYKEDTFDECEVESLATSETWDDVKRCRYLRGYDPPEMIMPQGEINVFVFGRDENDILEMRRQNEARFTEEVPSESEFDI